MEISEMKIIGTPTELKVGSAIVNFKGEKIGEVIEAKDDGRVIFSLLDSFSIQCVEKDHADYFQIETVLRMGVAPAKKE